MISSPSPTAMCRKVYTTVAMSFLLACPQLAISATTATEEWNISADKITHFEKPKRIVAEGSIVLEKKEIRQALPPKKAKKISDWDELLGEAKQEKEASAAELEASQQAKPAMQITTVINADWISYDVAQQSIEAKGNVKIVNGDETLMASAGQVNLENTTGTFQDAVIIRKEKQLHLEGKSVEKTGYNTYHIEQGWVITCKVDPGTTPPWSLASADTTIEKGGYATLKHARFNIQGVPVFYTPYMVIPVKDTRQTGLLFPEVSFSDNSGFGLNVPLFLNISNSSDITLFPEILTERGFKPGIEFRYVLDQSSKGVFLGSFINDALSDPSETEYYSETGFTHTNDDRYWFFGKADATFGDDWLVRLDLDVASDIDYLTEFNKGYSGYDKSQHRMLQMFGRGFDHRLSYYRDNSLSAVKLWDGMSLVTTLLAQNDVYDTRPATTPSALWKLPSVAFDGVLPFYSAGMTLNWQSEYVNYWREDGIGANRVDLHPSISMPVPISQYLESRAEAGVRETFYSVEEYGDFTWQEDSSQNRLLADFEYEIATTLLKEFPSSLGGGNTLEHQVRPFVRYNYIPDVDQEDLPLLDSIDRIDEESKITYGVDNFFNSIKSATVSKQYASVQVFQSYSLLDKDTDRPFYDIGARLTWTPQRYSRFKYEPYYDVYEGKFSSHNVEAAYVTPRGDIFSIDYSFYDTATTDFTKRIAYFKEYYTSETIEQIDAHIRTHLTGSWLAELELEHSISADETNTANISLIYKAPCWSVEFQSRYTPMDTQFVVVFNLANIGTDLDIGF